MGLIKAITGAAGGVMADSWLEFFYCDSLDDSTLMVKGKKRTSGRSSNTKGEDNIISNGSRIAVNEGQCMLIVEQGAVVDVCAEPGEFVYDKSTEPSIFYGGLGKGILDTFKTIGKRFTFGGDTGKDQRVYFINIKHIMGNKYGTQNPIPFRVIDNRVGLDVDIAIRCNGEYVYQITNPLLFYKNVCGNVSDEYERSRIDSTLKMELLSALQPALAKVSAIGVRYSELPLHTKEIRDALQEELTKDWKELRGIEIVSFGMNSATASAEDEAMIKRMQTLTNPTMAAAELVASQAEAMKSAAKNEAGAMMGFMGMGMAQQAGGMNAQNLYAMGQQQQMQQMQMQQQMQQQHVQQAQQQTQQAAQATAADSWTCKCGAVCTGKFCTECGEKKPSAEGWTCSCGAVNKGKFCPECGAKKPAGAPLYRCDKCGWEPEDPKNPPKFCPECGDSFDENDIKN